MLVPVAALFLPSQQTGNMQARAMTARWLLQAGDPDADAAPQPIQQMEVLVSLSRPFNPLPATHQFP
jgi:hypothetical protein